MSDASIKPAGSCEHCGLPVPSARLKRGGEAASFCCLGCHLVHQMVRAGEDDRNGAATHPFLLRLGLGIFLAMNIMAFSGFFYSQQVYDEAGHVIAQGSMLSSLFSYLLLFLCSLVILLLGGPLISEAIGGLGRREDGGKWSVRIDVNLLILVGVLAAYALSAINTLRGQGHLYYDTCAMILVLVTLGGYLDARAKRKAAASGEALLATLPARVWRREGDAVNEIDVAAVAEGDVVRIRPGETIAIDGDVLEGRSHLDESILTGESRHRAAEPGQHVMAGAMNIDGLLWVRASATQGERVIDQVKRMLEEARLRQPAIQRLADRVAAVFVPTVMLLALGVFGWHVGRGDVSSGLFTALSVLLISCPCALGLAAPLACYTALSRAARQGILIDSASTLEKLAMVRTVLFDKTGTLTRGRMAVSQVMVARGFRLHEVLRIAASLESSSTHPIAKAIVEHAVSRGLSVQQVQSARVLPGLGVEGEVDGRVFRLGSETLARQSSAPEDELLRGSNAGADVFLLEGDRILARLTLADEVRNEARHVLATLQSEGMSSCVLTGDDTDPAEQLGKQLNVDVIAKLLPADKVSHLERLRKERTGRVAFVGDGINDAPVMGAADVGIAVGNATDLAKQAGHVHLIGEGLDRLPQVFEIARDAMRRVRLNLAWAFGYNVIGLTLATLGLLSPIFAASSMVVSSLLIVWTSSRAPKSEDAAQTVEQTEGDGNSAQTTQSRGLALNV